jgi:low temperature requirement protein LtrA
LTIGGDWPEQATRKVEDVVSLIRDKTVRPISQVVRYFVFGLLAGAVGTVMAVLFAIFAIRVLDTEVPVFRTRVWASYLVVAGIFWLGGLLLSRKRHSRS